MVNSLISTAGVYTTETNVSQYVVQNNATIAGVVGLAPKGVPNTDILLTSFQDGLNKLGTPSEAYPALLFMREFFNAGGGIFHFVRATDNTDTVATATVPLLVSGNSTFSGKTSGSWY